MNSFNPINLEGKNILVTGAASGLGKAASLMLSKMGANLILVDINTEGLEKTAKDCCGYSRLISCDLSNMGGVKPLIVSELHGTRLNGLVHLAGIPCTIPVRSLAIDKVEKTLQINAVSVIELIQSFIDKRVFGGPNSSIVLISSVYGRVGSAANVAYAMSKGAIESMTRSLAIELAPKKIRVNCVAPGFIETPLMKITGDSLGDDYYRRLTDMHPLGLGQPEDIAYAVAYFLSDMSKWVTGATLSVDGGFTAQ